MSDPGFQGAVPGHRQGVRPRQDLGLLRGGLPADVPGPLRRPVRRPDPVQGRHDRGGRRRPRSTTCRRTRRRPSTTPSRSSTPTTSTTRSSKVRKGDADVAVEMQGDTLVAHYTQTDQVKAAVTAGRAAGLRRRHQRRAALGDAGAPPKYDLETERVEDDSLKTIQYYTPGLLGWAVAMSAAFGAAATIQGWRQSKLIRRLQLAPVSTRTVVGARVVGDRRHRARAAGDLRRARARRRSGSP